jgi:hypothetical protein
VTHVHTGHGPDKTGDCPGCEDEYYARLRREQEQREQQAKSLIDRLDEAEAKIAYLLAGCVNMTRDELIQKISEVGSARWSAEPWLQTRMTAAYQLGIEAATGYDREILTKTLVYHWPSQTASCLCGWNELGMSFPGHVADMYEANVRLGHVCDPRRCCTECDRHVTPHRGCILR